MISWLPFLFRLKQFLCLEKDIQRVVISIPAYSLEICPVTSSDNNVILEVYRQCEDFLALGPEATASMEMVLKDLARSQAKGGVFYGIMNADRQMIGVVDFVFRNYEGNPQHAFISLLMIAAPYRSKGIGQAVVQAIECEIRKDPGVTAILAGVQVNNPGAVKFWQRMGYRIVSGPTLMPDQTVAYGLQKDII